MGIDAPTATGVANWIDVDAPRVRGVARSLAHRFGAHRLVVRAAFGVLVLAGGVGIVAYAVVWLLTSDRIEASRQHPSIRNDIGVVLLVAAALSAATSLVPWLPSPMLWLVSLSVMGMAIAASSDADDQGDAALRGAPIRAGVGVVLVVAAVATALAGTQDLRGLWQGLLVMVALMTGLSIVIGPWLGRLSATAEHERLERIRAEERADIATHLHDSVLQTLTLIQNRASEPQVVAALAHQQERELRRWLYGSESVDPEAEASLRTVIERLAAEVEDQYLVAVESIVVGDHPLTVESIAIVGAAREAVVNAAKFSGSNMVSVFADVTDNEISVFIRDRGRGFDPDDVPPDRRGITESIIARVERVGGRVTIRSAPDRGTEVALAVRRSAGEGNEAQSPAQGVGDQP